MYRRHADGPTRALSLTIVLSLAVAACRSGGSPDSATPVASGADGATPSTAIAAPSGGAKVQASPTAPATRTPIAGQVFSVGGVSIRVPAALGSKVRAQEVPAELGASPRTSGVLFTIEDYPIERDRPATIEVRRGPTDGEAGVRTMKRFREMASIVSLERLRGPYLPIYGEPNAREQFVARLQFRSIGQGIGRGPRILTQFGSEVRPINNQELVYVLEGMIMTHASWLSIHAPVTVNDPAIAAGPVPEDKAAFAKRYTAYMGTTTKRLEELPPSAFSPNLDLLDSIANSITLDWPTPSANDIGTARARAQQGSAVAPTEASTPSTP